MQKRVLASASLFHGVNDACSVAVPMIFPLLYSQKIIITHYSHIGILSNLGLLTTLVCQIFVVNHAHRMEYKHTVLISLAGIALFLTLLTLPALSFASWMLLYLGLRAFMSFYHPIGTAVVSRTHPDKGLDHAIGIQSGSGNVGVFIAFISVGSFAQRFSWQSPLYIWAGAALGAGALSFAMVRSRNSLHKDLVKPRFHTWVVTARGLKRLLPGFVFGGACWGATVYYAPSLLNHRFQVPLGTTGIFLALWIALGAVMPYLYGSLSRSIGRGRLTLAGLAGSTVVVGVLGLAAQRELAVTALLVYGAFLFLIYPSLQACVGSRVPLPDQAVAFSVVANVQMLSGALVNLLSGFLSDRFGISSPFLFLAVMGIATTGYFIKDREALKAPRLEDSVE